MKIGNHFFSGCLPMIFPIVFPMTFPMKMGIVLFPHVPIIGTFLYVHIWVFSETFPWVFSEDLAVHLTKSLGVPAVVPLSSASASSCEAPPQLVRLKDLTGFGYKWD